MKRPSVILLLPLLLLLFACGSNSEADRLLSAADSLSCTAPDSALRLLTSASFASADRPSGSAAAPAGKALTTSQRMRLELLRARCMNKTFIPVGVDMRTPSDSMLLLVAGYYDRHGSPNEQMEAHYLLGCAYRDMGEAPRAVDCYLDAIAKADTTAENCDYRILSSVYAQMAFMFHQQLLLEKELMAHRKACYYNYLCRDTLKALYENKMEAGVYALQNKYDSAEIVVKKVIEQYDIIGCSQEAIITSTMLMHLYIDMPERMSELGELIKKYEEESKLFDDNHELHDSDKLYYRYKGKYLESNNLLDSAEYTYRKMVYPNMPLTSKNAMYEGLLSIYSKRHQTDSIAKYAKLYCAVNDSSIVIRDQEQTTLSVSAFNYLRYQKLARYNSDKASQRLLAIVVISSGAVLCIILLFMYIAKKRAERNRLMSDYVEISENYEKQLSQLAQKEKNHELLVETVNKKLGKAKKENDKLHLFIKDLNTIHEDEKLSLMSEIDYLKIKAEHIEQKFGLLCRQEKTNPFFEMGIVKRIRIYAKQHNKLLEDNDKLQLFQAAAEKLPHLINDLNNAQNITSLSIDICLLTLLNLKSGEITHLLGISSSQVGNLKKSINRSLFNEDTARTLYINLSLRYGLNTD